MAILVAAVFSTASAINATIFATGRLAKRVAKDGQLPPELTRWTSGGVPVCFVGLTAVMAALVQFFGNLNQITGFSSLTFLVVFAVVNAAAVKHGSFRGWRQVFPALGCGGCVGAAVLLVVDIFRSDPATVWVIVAIAGLLTVLRIGYVYLHPHFLKHASPAAAQGDASVRRGRE